jgi:hypothetical protein
MKKKLIALFGVFTLVTGLAVSLAAELNYTDFFAINEECTADYWVCVDVVADE